MVDAARSQAHLGNLETPAFAKQDVLFRYAHVVELDVHVAVRRIVVTEYMHWPEDVYAGRVDGHQYLRLPAVRRRVGTGFHHGDHDLAAWVAGAGNVEFFAVDDPFAVLEHGSGADVLRVRGGQVRFRHRVGRANLAVQQGFQPLFLLRLCADPLQHFHVAGVRGAAVQGFRGQRAFAEYRRNVGVVKILKALAGVRIGQEEVPESGLLRLVLGAVQQLQLPGRPTPAVLTAFAETVELFGDRIDVFNDVFLDRIEQRPRLVGHDQVIQIGVQAVFFGHCFPRNGE